MSANIPPWLAKSRNEADVLLEKVLAYLKAASRKRRATLKVEAMGDLLEVRLLRGEATVPITRELRELMVRLREVHLMGKTQPWFTFTLRWTGEHPGGLALARAFECEKEPEWLEYGLEDMWLQLALFEQGLQAYPKWFKDKLQTVE